MVTIFDMVTGEILAEETRPRTHQAPQHAGNGVIAPRLQTFEEAQLPRARPGMPADLAQADVDSFLRRQ